MGAVLAGFFTGLSLIVAIGAQNAYLLRLGLTRRYVGVAMTICVASDVALILLGTAGVGVVVRSYPSMLNILKWVGVAYLVGFALYSFYKASKREVLLPSESEPPARKVVIATMFAFTLLNPHVYLDTVLLLGSVANQYGSNKWLFAIGACAASALWFTSLGFGAKAASAFMARPVTWRILDVLIGVIMLAVAFSVASTHIGQ